MIAAILGAGAFLVALASPASADVYAWGSALPLAVYGDIGGQVIGAQAAMVAHGYYHCGVACQVDGNFGANTRYEVELYQTNHGLVSDGDVGTNTWNSLQGGLIHFESSHPDYELNPAGNTTVFDGITVNSTCTWNTWIDTDAYPSSFAANTAYRMDLTTIHQQTVSGSACQP